MIAASHSTYSKPTNQPTCIPPITNVIVDRLAAVRNPKFFSPITAFQRVVPVPGTNSTRIVIQSLNYVKSTGGVAKCLSITQVSIQLICMRTVDRLALMRCIRAEQLAGEGPA